MEFINTCAEVRQNVSLNPHSNLAREAFLCLHVAQREATRLTWMSLPEERFGSEGYRRQSAFLPRSQGSQTVFQMQGAWDFCP